MTRRYILKYSGISRLRAFGNWLWLKAANPKLWTITIVITYAFLFAGWIPALVNPPGSIEGVTGVILMYAIAILVTIGSFAGMFTAFFGIFKVEKWCVLMAAVGIIMYVIVVHTLHWTSGGNRLPQANTISALLPTFVARFIHVVKRDRAEESELLIKPKAVD